MPSLYSVNKSYPKKGQRHIIQSLFFIFVFSLAIFVFFQSSFFSVKEIIVVGNKQLKKEEILSLTGLSKGINIFKANLREAGDKVALHPMIKHIDLSRDFPATIAINLTERKPIGLIPGDNHFVITSEDGYYLSRVDNLSCINLPIITGVKTGTASPGQEITGEKMKAALSYLRAMPESIRAAVSEINVSDLNNIRMFTIDGAEVRFGDGERSKEKLKLYQDVISQKYKEKIQYVDISYKGNPVIKFIEETEG